MILSESGILLSVYIIFKIKTVFSPSCPAYISPSQSNRESYLSKLSYFKPRGLQEDDKIANNIPISGLYIFLFDAFSDG